MSSKAALTPDWSSISKPSSRDSSRPIEPWTRRPGILPISTGLRALLEMRRHNSAGREFGRDAFVFWESPGRTRGLGRHRLTARLPACGYRRLHLHDLRGDGRSRLLKGGGHLSRRRRRQAVRQRSAKPPSPVQFRAAPPNSFGKCSRASRSFPPKAQAVAKP
jgi:hypothetical protein